MLSFAKHMTTKERCAEPVPANAAGAAASEIAIEPAGTGGLVAPACRRQRIAAAAIAISSLVWVTALSALGYAQQSLPWCITLAATAAGAIVTANQKKSLCTFNHVVTSDRRPVSFMEASALTYIIVSMLLAGWIILHLLHKEPPPIVKHQVVDVELMSLADFKDNHDILPGTAERKTLRKRTASVVTSHGSLSAVSVPNPRTKPAKAESLIKQSADPQPEKVQAKAPRINEAMSMLVRPPRSTVSPVVESGSSSVSVPLAAVRTQAPPNATVQSKTRSDDQPFMEEVTPPELVEMMDNEGDDSLNIWQQGGHLAGGTGSKSDLVAYLKDINKRIKSVWSPPRGEPWKTEILFRILRTGKLESARIVHSSGSRQADDAALKALVASAPFKGLPATYPYRYLDLHYSFNYNVDELEEIKNAPPR